MGLLKLTIDRQTKSLVPAGIGQSATFPPLYQTNEQDFQIQITDPATSFGGEPVVIDCSTFTFRAVLFIRATGTEGDEDQHMLAATYEAGWTWDAGLEAFLGTMDFHTAEIAAFLEDNDVEVAAIEFNLIKPSGRAETVLKAVVSLRANADVGQATAPSVLAAPASIGTLSIQTSANVSITDNVVTVTGLGLGFTPSYWLLFISAPSGSGPIGPNYINGSGNSGGFAFIMTAIPENTGYFVTYIPVP